MQVKLNSRTLFSISDRESHQLLISAMIRFGMETRYVQRDKESHLGAGWFQINMHPSSVKSKKINKNYPTHTWSLIRTLFAHNLMSSTTTAQCVSSNSDVDKTLRTAYSCLFVCLFVWFNSEQSSINEKYTKMLKQFPRHLESDHVMYVWFYSRLCSDDC